MKKASERSLYPIMLGAYVTQATAEGVKRAADSFDVSVSEYIRLVLREATKPGGRFAAEIGVARKIEMA